MVKKKVKKSKKIKKFIEPEWDPKYVKMLDAVMEYMDEVGSRDKPVIAGRDILIIRSLIEFYDFEVNHNQDLLDVLADVKIRSDQVYPDQ